MNGKTKLNYLIDWLLFIAMLVIIASGIVLWGWKKPAGMNGPGSQYAPGEATAKMQSPVDGSIPRNYNNQDGKSNHGYNSNHGNNSNQNPLQESASSPKAAPKNDLKAASENESVKDPRSSVKPDSLKSDGKNAVNKDNQPKILWGLFHGQTFWGMTKNGGWKEIHCWVSVLILVPFFFFHLLMHLKWIGTTTVSLFGKNTSKKSSTDSVISESSNNQP